MTSFTHLLAAVGHDIQPYTEKIRKAEYELAVRMVSILPALTASEVKE